jgi:hypothetical protein
MRPSLKAKRQRQREARIRRKHKRENYLYYGTAGAGVGLILERGLVPMSTGLLLHEDFNEAGKRALSTTATLYLDGSKDPRGLVVTVSVDRDQLTPDGDGRWRSHEPISVEAIEHLTMSDETENLADPEVVNALAEQLLQEEPDLREVSMTTELERTHSDA